MTRCVLRRLLAAFTGLTLIAIGSTALAVTGAGMKACELAVLQKSKFQDLPMAVVSVYPGKDDDHAHFTVRWDGLKADGGCKVDRDDQVQKVHVKNFHDGRSGNSDNGNSGNAFDNSEGWNNSGGLDGFYYDRHVNKWRDPGGRVCHTCTSENGFPDHSKHHHQDYRPKNEYEEMMQHEMKNMLSDEDIKNLNALGN